jgi:hypothetical protein
LTRKVALVLETDFYNVTSPFAQGLTGSAISSGTVASIAAEPNHPGIMRLSDSTTANGGYLVQTAVDAFRIAGGEKVVCTFQCRSARTTSQGWIGFKDNTTNAQPTDGVFLYWVGNGAGGVTVDGRARNNAGPTITNTTYTLAINTWVTIVIELNAAATLATFTLTDDSDGVLWTNTVAGNIPTASGRECGVGISANESTTDAAAELMRLDYFRAEVGRTLTR